MKRLVAGIAVVTWGCAAGAAPAVAGPAKEVFRYWGANDEFAYRIDLRADRRWARQEHSGHQTPAGRLSPRRMKRFMALLAAAPFRSEPVRCPGPVIAHATYDDLVRGRHAHAAWWKDADGRWAPCGEKVDVVTERLTSCLELLTQGSDVAAKETCAVSPPAAP